MENEKQSIEKKLDLIDSKLQKIESAIVKVDLDKAAFTQDEIVQAMGLKGPQRRLLDFMKKEKLLHSPISKKPLIYPGTVVRKAIEKINMGKVEMK
jgi:hypothetical protein